MSAHYLYGPVLDARTVGKDAAGEHLVVVEFGDGDYGFRHVCKKWPDDQEPDGEFVKVVAPRLTNHTVTGWPDNLTIRASILCADCGIHGFVTDGRWEAA